MSKRAAGDDETSVASKKAKVDEDASDSNFPPDNQLKKDNEGNYYLDLGNMKRATVNTFKGKAQMNIREYYSDKNEDVKPGKKGITLNRSQWDIFLSGINSLSQQLETVEAGGTEKSSTSKKKSDEKKPKAKK
ncbi:ssDNA-binding transcriptional regulator [Ramaria rubella]|nr:ssDNA-binding transcriptional regulator [Ramaria rubella]